MGVFLALRGIIAFIPAFVWKWLAIAAIGGMLFMAGDIRGRRIEKAICAEAAHQADLAADAQDDAATTEVTSQNDDVQKLLLEQKKVDDATIDSLRVQLTKQPAGAPATCLYDKSNADPDEQPSSDGVRLTHPGPGAGDKKSPRPAGVPAAGGDTKSHRWGLPLRRSGAAKAGDR